MNRQTGFTLIELIMVMVIIGILSVSVIPRLLGVRDFAARTVMNQYIGQLRLVQLQALNHRGVCHNSVFNTISGQLVFGIVDNHSSSCGSTTIADSQVEVGEATIALVNGSDNGLIKTSPTLVFDGDGIATTTGGGDCAGACKIKVSAVETLYICIESQGYIHQVSGAYVCN